MSDKEVGEEMKMKSGIVWRFNEDTGLLKQDFSIYNLFAIWIAVPRPEPSRMFDALPFHCAACAKDCIVFGNTRQQAWDCNHGNAEERYFSCFGG